MKEWNKICNVFFRDKRIDFAFQSKNKRFALWIEYMQIILPVCSKRYSREKILLNSLNKISFNK